MNKCGTHSSYLSQEGKDTSPPLYLSELSHVSEQARQVWFGGRQPDLP